ncbi:hypothetical protein LTS18_012611 [Coniosporium uncinatum]|uniref:Uncharacterized protein n=1 Tax=Coniosporium uncinatum TaxID=93489 RepID=A0ACC3CXB1_9PEZI|nr:hypothetical protein LTS18_012611 [Coniosporium uncinatum]
MHSARWDWSYDMKGKKIGMIGNGATAAQILPEIAKVASSVTVYQRSPNWVIPREDKAVGPLKRAVFRYLPPIRWKSRALMMDFRESFYDAVIDGQSPFAGMIREMCIGQMHAQLPGKEDLWQKLTPDYNPGCKRIIISDDYYPAIARDNVSLETRKIERITESGIDVEGGHEDYDMLVLATGFRTVEFMHPIKIIGANGRPLSEIWDGGARAYQGTCVEDLPNFGMLYGPNTNLGHNSIILMIESQSRYLNGLISAVLAARRSSRSLSLKPKPDVIKAYNERIQAVLQNSSFADPKCNSWYKNKDGIITNNWSGTVVEYQQQLSEVDFDDYIIEGDGANAVMGGSKRKINVGRVVEESQVSLTTMAVTAVGVAALAGGMLLRNTRFMESVRVR